MQTNEIWKSAKWKFVAGAATLIALGIGGLALADTGDRALPLPIRLQDQATTAETLTPVPDFVVSPDNEVDLTDLDSSFQREDELDDSVAETSGAISLPPSPAPADDDAADDDVDEDESDEDESDDP